MNLSINLWEDGLARKSSLTDKMSLTRNQQAACITELFKTQVRQIPDDIVVVFEEQKLTYQELNAQANQLAYYLQNLGVKS